MATPTPPADDGRVMIPASIRRGAGVPRLEELVTAALRCWRAARDRGGAVQQDLHALLSPHDCEMLAPVFDSLMRLCEAALGRPVSAGAGNLSADERLLIGLVDGSRSRRVCIECSDGAASALDCAICSTRIMMALTLGPLNAAGRR